MTAAQSAEPPVPKRSSLPSKLRPDDAGELLGGRRVALGEEHDGDRREEDDAHHGEDHPALAAVADEPAVGRGQRRGEREDQPDLDRVRQAVRVLERHRRVHVEEPAAVRPELLDRLLRGDRPARERLGGAAEGVDAEVAAERLQHALGDQDDRRDERDREQHVEDRAEEVDPEVADQVTAAAVRERPDERDRDGDADAGRDEVLHRQPGHLAEVRHRRLAAVELPVRVRDERRGRVERDVPGRRLEALRVPGMQALGAQDEVEHEPREEREGDRRERVRLPVLAAIRVGPQQAAPAALDRREHRGQPACARRGRRAPCTPRAAAW